MTIFVYAHALHCCVRSDKVKVSFFNRNFIEEGLTFPLSGKKIYPFILCRSCFPVLIVNLSILNRFNPKILFHSGLIDIFFISNCFT